MLLLLPIAFGAGLVTVLTPCILPVLPIVLAGGGSGGRRRPYAIGAALPMLAIAHGSRRAVARFRVHAQTIRVALGVVMAVAAVAIYEGWETSLQTKIPGYASSLQSWIEGNGTAKRELAKLRGTPGHAESAVTLHDYGPAPRFTGISHWLNSPGNRGPALQGKVVLVDFWTYSCINCLRTLSHLEAWDTRYRKAGLAIVGIHTPEFAFEHDLGNVRGAVKRLG